MSENKLASVELNDHICLNYMDFLSSSCKKRWSFVDAIYGVIPFFGMITRKNAGLPQPRAERIKALALQIISTQVSDEINIARLVTLAGQLDINRFDILLPYPLTGEQLTQIHQEYARPLTIEQHDDRLSIVIP